MTRILSNMRIDEVSLVPRGADPDAHIVLAKSADGASPEAPSTEENHVPTDKLPEAVAKALEGVELSDEQTDALSDALTVETEPVEEPVAVLDEPVTEPVVEPVTEPVDEPVTEPVTEPETETADAVLAKAVTDATADMQKQLDTQSELLNKELVLRKVREYTDVAKATYPASSQKAEVLGEVLFRMDENEMTDEDRGVIRDVLASESRLAEVGTVFSEAGTTAVGASEGAGTLEKSAAQLRTENPDLTPQQAIAEAARINPEAYVEHVQDMRDKRR